MSIAVRVIGIIIAIFTVIMLVRPQTMKKFLEYFIKHAEVIKWAAAVRIIIGAFLWLAASACRWPIIIIILGIIMIATGLITFLIGEEKVKIWLGKIDEKSPTVHRVFSAIALVFGLFMIFAA